MVNLITSSINIFIKNAPRAIAIVDRDMCLVGYSDIWLKDIANSQSSLEGKSYYEILPDISEKLKKTHQSCLNGNIIESKTTKSIDSSGTIQWTKWTIHTWNDEDNSVAGLVIVEEDVTTDKHREDVLLRAQSVARIGGWELDMKSGHLDWTDITKVLHEVPSDFKPNLEEGINFYKEGSSRDEITRLISDAMALGKPWDTELQIVTAKGNDLWVRAKGETEILNGKCIRIFGTFQDIDEKKRTELEFQKVSNRLTIATNAGRIGIWEYDLTTNKLVWDDHMFTIFNIDKKTFTCQYETWKNAIHPDDLEFSEEAVELAIAGKKELNLEFRIIWANGAIKYIKGRGSVIKNSEGQPIKMIGTNWDVTKYRNVKLELIRNNESFTSVFANSTTGMALVGHDGKWLEVNKSICISLGYSREELLKTTFQEITHPDDLDLDLNLLQEVTSGKISSYQIEKRYYHKNRNLVHSMLTVTAVRDINGNISHFISQIVDITSRIEAEKRLQTLVEVTKGQNASLMNFAHIVSHNLRSHSSNMLMLTKFLNQENKDSEKENIELMLGNAAESLNETVNHLNEVVLIKTGSLEAMKSENLINAILRVKDTVAGLIQEKNAAYQLNICRTHFVNVVPAYLDSILLNLFTNSLKYSSPHRKPIINISSKINNDYIEVQFSDNGQGIDLKRHGKKIFGMYKTFHNNKDAKGIGLFITKNQIEAMNGKIELKSELDKGTTFTLKFKKV